MAVIEGGNIIPDGSAPGTKTRRYTVHGAPVAGTTLAGTVKVGDFVQDVDTGDLYEYTEPTGTPTYTRIDTV